MRISGITILPINNFYLPLLILLCLIISGASGNPDSYLGIEPFTSSTPDSFPRLLLDEALFKRLHYEVLPHGVKPLLIKDSIPPNCVIIAGGTIQKHNNIPVVLFRLTNRNEEGEETKMIPLNNRTVDEVLDIMVLKIRQFLEQNISGKVRISSVPLDCEILLNGITIGTTPAELILEKGVYDIRLQREFLTPYHDSIKVDPGNESVIQASMRFQGYNTKPWIISSSLVTLCTVAAWIIESRFHRDYGNLPPGSEEFDTYYTRYRAANYIKIGLLNTSILGWTVTGFELTRNNALKQRIFGNVKR